MRLQCARSTSTLADSQPQKMFIGQGCSTTPDRLRQDGESMSTILIFIAALLACLYCYHGGSAVQTSGFTVIMLFQDAQTRKLLPEEQRGRKLSR